MIETVGTARRGYFAEHARLHDITFGAWTAAPSASGSVHEPLEFGHAGVANSRRNVVLTITKIRRFVIVFGFAICYAAKMERSIDQASKVKQPRGIRRSLLAMLAFVYLFVGIAHNIACFDQAVASSFAIENVSDTTDNGEKSSIAMCDHCPTCVPAVMPAPSVAAVPSALPAEPVVAVASVLIAGRSRLDTPPPRILT